VEGCEYAVLQGAEKLLLANTDVLLLFECTWQGCYWAGSGKEDVFGFLRSIEFNLFCWNNKTSKWESDEKSLLVAGNLWACRDPKRLPTLA